MQQLFVKNLNRTYRVFRKREGLWSSLRGLFKREYNTVEAVRDVSFTIDEEKWLHSRAQWCGQDDNTQASEWAHRPVVRTATVLGHVPWKRKTFIVDGFRW